MTNAADDFDALFDEVSAQRTEAPKPAPAAPAEIADDDFDALFDSVSASTAPAAPAPAAAPAPTSAPAADKIGRASCRERVF